jgi:hypothetical protein
LPDRPVRDLGSQNPIQSSDESIDLLNRIVVNHRHADNATMTVEIEVLDEPS